MGKVVCNLKSAVTLNLGIREREREMREERKGLQASIL